MTLPKLHLEVRQVELPLVYYFAHMSHIRSKSSSVIALISYRKETGVGESAPRPYVTGETLATVQTGIRSWWKDNEATLSSYLATVQSAIDTDNGGRHRNPSIGHWLATIDNWISRTLLRQNERCAIQLAIRDLVQKLAADAAPVQPVQTEKKVLSFIPVQDSSGRWSIPSQALANARMVKIKATADVGETAQRIRNAKRFGIHDVIVDANNSWYFRGSAQAWVDVCLSAGASWFEEPVAVRDYSTLRSLRRRGARILLDESVTGLADLDTAVRELALDAVNIRVAKLGGLEQGLRVAARAKRHGVSRYYGVQVAEVGTLITAGRLLAAMDDDALAIEVGQPDLFFRSEDLWVDAAMPDRDSLTVELPSDHKLNGRIPV